MCFLETLREACDKTRWKVRACVLVGTPEGNLVGGNETGCQNGARRCGGGSAVATGVAITRAECGSAEAPGQRSAGKGCAGRVTASICDCALALGQRTPGDGTLQSPDPGHQPPGATAESKTKEYEVETDRLNGATAAKIIKCHNSTTDPFTFTGCAAQCGADSCAMDW